MGLIESYGNRPHCPFGSLDHRSGQVFHNVRRNRSIEQKERKNLPQQSSYFIFTNRSTQSKSSRKTSNGDQFPVEGMCLWKGQIMRLVPSVLINCSFLEDFTPLILDSMTSISSKQVILFSH